MSVLPDPIRTRIDYTLAKPTRSHPLANFPAAKLWIKREDELSAGISGSKLRKYASLMPKLKADGIQTVGMIGGPNSNNLVGLAQLLRENAIKPIAFIREAADAQLRGNALLLGMLLAADEIVTVARDKWASVEQLAQSHLAAQENDCTKSLLLREGCYGFDALPGAMTLAEDILRNERESQRHFARVYIDCGTGLSAIGLILGFELLSPSPLLERELVITLIAEREETFLKKLAEMRAKLEEHSPYSLLQESRIRFLKPSLSPKFGSINRSLFDQCRSIARIHGIIMDPTYSVKHYDAVRLDLLSNSSDENALFVFNGSPLGLLGFQEKLQIQS